IQNPNRNAVRMLLKTLAYEQQDELLPAKWEIEHIFPQKWQTNYFPDESDETIKEKIEHIGNKLPFEKKLNIVAGNGYFAKKKKEYTASKIAITNAMGISDVQDWNMDSIMKRDIRISDEIIKILNRWNNEYLNIPVEESEAEEPSEEDLARIEEFKKKGWI
ncbi:MAG: HNH endonuclease family protein, partial [Lachnospiraceae bacterium]|nr:HNH endonuclease family protein [Lachnospiraceae bacterium]